MRAVAVLLAAEDGAAMGHPIALVEHEGGRSFLRSLALNFARAGAHPLAVIGAEAPRVREQHPDLDLVEDAEFRHGLLGQLRRGLDKALAEGAEWVLVHPVDMPAVRTQTLKALLSRLASEPSGDGARPSFEGASGFPLALTRAAAQRLVASTAPSLEAAISALDLAAVPTRDPGVVVHIRSADTYQRLFGGAPRLAPPPRRRARKETA